MKNKLKNIIFYVCLYAISCLLITLNKYYHILKAIFGNDILNTSLIAFICGVFGFTIAAIPFVLSMLNNNQYLIEKINEDKKFFENLFQPFVGRFLRSLYSALSLFFTLIFVFLFKNNLINFLVEKTYTIYFDLMWIVCFILLTLILFLYMVMVYLFFRNICILLRDIRITVDMFIADINKKLHKHKSDLF